MAGGVDAVVVVLLAPAPLRVGLLHWVHSVLASCSQFSLDFQSAASLRRAFEQPPICVSLAQEHQHTSELKKPFWRSQFLTWNCFMILIEIQLGKQQKKRQAAVTPFVLFFFGLDMWHYNKWLFREIKMAMALEAATAGPASEVAALTATTVTNEEDDPMVTILPQEVIDALAELDLELSEGRKNIYFFYFYWWSWPEFIYKRDTFLPLIWTSSFIFLGFEVKIILCES